MIFSIANSVYELPHWLPNDLRLRILENKKILEKCEIWVETQPSAQSSLQKYNVAIVVQKQAKIDIKLFLSSLILLGFSVFFPNIFFRIVWGKKDFGLKSSLPSSTLCFWYFLCYQTIYQIFKPKYKARQLL